ncbi:hypothetical protein LCGC14_1015660 [marine sediment metagenome]|uniref:Uncharacterized protein n=1 Tax=marine sediment metagenome TaxID=412755 RepID=A0A0F9MYW5_9ZZZZ
MKLTKIIRNLIIVIFISFSLLFFFQYLFNSYIIPNNFEISISISLGITIIIIGIFYSFLMTDSHNNRVITIRFLDEYPIKIILIILMSISIFIPPINFSDLIISWAEVPTLNYIRAIILIVGSLYIPGACIFNLALPKSTIHKRLHVEPLLVKLTIYPLISLTYLGSLTLILDFFGFTRVLIFIFLFLSFVILLGLDILFHKKREGLLKSLITRIQISKYVFLLLFIGIGIIIIALGTILSFHPYILSGDRWRGIASSSFTGILDSNPFLIGKVYSAYWGVVSLSLSILSGLPSINANILLFILLYLSITTIYFLIKALLNEIGEKICVLASILGGILFNSYLIIFQFSYQTFSFYSLFISLTLFLIVIKSDHLESRKKLTTENKVLLSLSAIFLIQSFFTYFFPALIGIIFIFLYSLFSDNFKRYTKYLLVFYLFFVIFFIFFNTMTYNFYGFRSIIFLSDFSGINFYFSEISSVFLRYFLVSLLFYSLLLSLLIILIYIHKNRTKISTIIKKAKMKIKMLPKKKYKILYFFMLFLFVIFLLIAVININVLGKFLNLNSVDQESSFFIYYIDLLLGTVGFTGILGILLSYFCYKENKILFFLLLIWIMIIILFASLLLYFRWIQYPTYLVSEIPVNEYKNMIHWYTRLFYYVEIPLSIFASIGLIRLIQKYLVLLKNYHGRFKINAYKSIHKITLLPLISLLIFPILANPIKRIIFWDNYDRSISDEYAQIFGWTSKNVPYNSPILVYPSNPFFKFETDLYLYKTYYLSNIMSTVLSNYEPYDKDLYKWHINNTNNGNVKLFYEEDNRTNVMVMQDKTSYGNISIYKDFRGAQTNGTLSFNLKMDITSENNDGVILVRIYGENNSEGIDFYLNDSYHYYYNDTNDNYEKTNITYGINDWNYYEISFICNQNSSYWNISMNGFQMKNNITEESQFGLKGQPINLSRIQIYNTFKNPDFLILFDDFNFSWEPPLENEYYERILLNDMTKLIYYLNSSKICYFVRDREYSYQDRELIDYFYRITLYEYGSCVIYKSIFS